MRGCTILGNCTTYLQPIRAFTTTKRPVSAKIVWAEALLRERCSDGARFPKDLMDELENDPNGVEGLQEITRFVLFDACRASAELGKVHGNIFPVAVNVSPKQLSAELVQNVGQALWQVGLSSASLIIEVTEQRGPISTEMVHTVKTLESIGIRVAIDDLGIQAGNRAWELPHSIVKLDQALIKQPPCLMAHLNLAHVREMEAVVEGVETLTDLALVLRLAADAGFREILIQGFYQGYRPMPLEKLARVFEAEQRLIQSPEKVAA